MKILFTYSILGFFVLVIRAQPTIIGAYPTYLFAQGACASHLEGNHFYQGIVYGDSLDSLVIIKFSGYISGNYQNLGDFNFTSTPGTGTQRGQGIQTPSTSRFTMIDNWLLPPKSQDGLYINFYYGNFISVPDSIQVTIDSVWYVNQSTGDTFQITTDAKSPIFIIRSCPLILPWYVYVEPASGCYGKRFIHWQTEYTVTTYCKLVEKNILYGPFAANDSAEITVDTSHAPGTFYHFQIIALGVGTDTGRFSGIYHVKNCPVSDVSSLDITEAKIYPNPTTGLLFIDAITPITEINIYNTAGALISQIKEPQSKSIDLSNFATGVYIAEIKLRGETERVRWVKM